jgi:hypothetical protein
MIENVDAVLEPMWEGAAEDRYFTVNLDSGETITGAVLFVNLDGVSTPLAGKITAGPTASGSTVSFRFSGAAAGWFIITAACTISDGQTPIYRLALWVRPRS